jgi:hypothetical protein
MDEFTQRGREWDDRQCDEFAARDAARDPKEFLPEIYREANNGNQHPANQIAKTLSKCSALFVRLSDDQTKAAKRLERLTVALFTLYLYRDTHALIQRETAAQPHDAKNQ